MNNLSLIFYSIIVLAYKKFYHDKNILKIKIDFFAAMNIFLKEKFYVLQKELGFNLKCEKNASMYATGKASSDQNYCSTYKFVLD